MSSNSSALTHHIGAVGIGRMGRSIAVAFALAGQDFYLIDLKARTADDWQHKVKECTTELAEIYQHLLQLGVVKQNNLADFLSHIHLVSAAQSQQTLSVTTVLFEAVPETLQAKQDALSCVSEYLPADAIIASTSSTMLVSELAAFVMHPTRFMNAHWLNPAYLVPLVEVALHQSVSEQAKTTLLDLLKQVGKVPVLCQGQPGYIVPRLQVLIMNEAARMIEQGAATAEDIDKAIKYGFGPRYASMGVVEFIDFGGLDILYHASRYLHESLQDSRYASPDIVNDKMQKGELGVRNGQGFYPWTPGMLSRFQARSMSSFVHLLQMQSKETD